MKLYTLLAILLATIAFARAQTSSVTGLIRSGGKPVSFAAVAVAQTRFGAQADSAGRFSLTDLPIGRYQLQVSAVGFQSYTRSVDVRADKTGEPDHRVVVDQHDPQRGGRYGCFPGYRTAQKSGGHRRDEQKRNGPQRQ